MANAATATVQTQTVQEESPYSPANPEFWVYAGLTIFILIAIFVVKGPRRIAEALDARIADARRMLDEAAALKQEAQAMLVAAEARTAAGADDAAAILAQARDEAERLIADADAEARALVARRTRMAEDRIAAAERQAIAELRAGTATAATEAARRLIVDGHGADADRPLVDHAIRALN